MECLLAPPGSFACLEFGEPSLLFEKVECERLEEQERCALVERVVYRNTKFPNRAV